MSRHCIHLALRAGNGDFANLQAGMRDSPMLPGRRHAPRWKAYYDKPPLRV